MIVIGIDPHKQTHTAVAIDGGTGQVLGELTVQARGEHSVRVAPRMMGVARRADSIRGNPTRSTPRRLPGRRWLTPICGSPRSRGSNETWDCLWHIGSPW